LTTTVLAEGRTGDGHSWRFELRSEPDGPPLVCLAHWDSAARDAGRRHLVVSGGSPRRESSADVLVQLGSDGSFDGHGYVTGEVARSVAEVRVVLDDGSDVVAEICPTDQGHHDLFLAFTSAETIPVSARAFDRTGRVIAEHRKSAELIDARRQHRDELD
jgi:hypothetical protein